jgi:hypothetical protein
MFPILFSNNKTCNWSIGFLQIVNISKLYHILGSNHSTFYVWSFQVSFPYKFLILKMGTLLLTKYMWETITFHCLPSLRCQQVGLGLSRRRMDRHVRHIQKGSCPSVKEYSSIFKHILENIQRICQLHPIANGQDWSFVCPSRPYTRGLLPRPSSMTTLSGAYSMNLTNLIDQLSV